MGYRIRNAALSASSARLPKKLFPMQTIDGWTFDVELLFIAQKRGYKIVEVPITWIYKDHSKVKPLRDLYKVISDFFNSYRLNSMRGVYKR